MADEILKSRHAFGESKNVANALSLGAVDKFDILFLDGDTAEPKIGWVTKNNEIVIMKDKEQVIPVDELPKTGEKGILYICDEVGYIWNGTGFIAITQKVDVAGLETRMDSLQTELDSKVDESRVTEMISEVAGLEIVEF